MITAMAQIPIIDAAFRIVGWTDTAPTRIADGGLKHPEAETLLGSRVSCVLVSLRGDDAARAGAPPPLLDRWQCFAIVPLEADRRSA